MTRQNSTLGRALLLTAVCALLAPLPSPGVPAGPLPLTAQEGASEGPDVRIGGLLRTGFVAGPGSEGVRDGFEIYDARLRAQGEIGIVFHYFVQGEFDVARDEFGLLDARLRLPIRPGVNLDLGQFRAPFSREELQGKGEVTFLERSQIVQAVAPGRQVGARVGGELREGRLSYGAGIFNGNGRSLENDNDSFLYAARIAYNNVGQAEFYDEFVVDAGANLAYSEDAGVDLQRGRLGRENGFRMDPRYEGDRFLWGGDLRLGYRGFFLRGEYLRADFDPPATMRVLVRSETTGLRSSVTVLAEELEGAYLEGGYNFLGAIEGVVRYDTVADLLPEGAAGLTELAGDFLVFGLNLFPGYETKIGLQYATGLGDAQVGPGLSDGEFALNAQVDF